MAIDRERRCGNCAGFDLALYSRELWGACFGACDLRRTEEVIKEGDRERVIVKFVPAPELTFVEGWCESHVFPGEQVERYRAELELAISSTEQAADTWQREEYRHIGSTEEWQDWKRHQLTLMAKLAVLDAALAELEAQDV
jgi:hypothetical protein